MDWATFFQENSQSLFTLLWVFLGSVITYAINFQSLRTQARERDKERYEQRSVMDPKNWTLPVGVELKTRKKVQDAEETKEL
jgi:hypothetical protein